MPTATTKEVSRTGLLLWYIPTRGSLHPSAGLHLGHKLPILLWCCGLVGGKLCVAALLGTPLYVYVYMYMYIYYASTHTVYIYIYMYCMKGFPDSLSHGACYSSYDVASKLLVPCSYLSHVNLSLSNNTVHVRQNQTCIRTSARTQTRRYSLLRSSRHLGLYMGDRQTKREKTARARAKARARLGFKATWCWAEARNNVWERPALRSPMI